MHFSRYIRGLLSHDVQRVVRLFMKLKHLSSTDLHAQTVFRMLIRSRYCLKNNLLHLGYMVHPLNDTRWGQRLVQLGLDSSKNEQKAMNQSVFHRVGLVLGSSNHR